MAITTLKNLETHLKNISVARDFMKNASLKKRAAIMKKIAAALEENKDSLLKTAHTETSLSIPRLGSEFKRTLHQLRSYADFCASGEWMDIRIDTTGNDLRKTMVPLGPVLVFGSSNFPFAYSTPGGDTASAWAAGCPVIVKAHSAHIKTSTAVAAIFKQVLKDNEWPEGLFTHLIVKDYAVTEALVKHPLIAAVGFTGSISGGCLLYTSPSPRD